MGKATKARREKFAAQEAAILNSLAVGTKKAENDQETCQVTDSHLFNIIGPYKHLFLNQPQDWKPPKSGDPRRRLRSLVRFVFAKYHTPECLYEAWYAQIPEKRPLQWYQERASRTTYSDAAGAQDFKMWYICLAQGGSLYKTYGKGIMTKQEMHHFTINPHHEQGIRQALWWSVARAVNPAMAIKVCQSRITERPFDAFWQGVARYVAAIPLARNTISDLTDYIVFARQEKPEWSLAGRSIESLLRQMDSWHRDMARMKSVGGGSWNGLDAPDRRYTTGNDQNKTLWLVEQIKTGDELAKEGNKMRHCVSMYKMSCVEGKTSIWSMTRHDRTGDWRSLTIRVNNQTREVVEARGLANRAPRPDENNILRKWASDNRLHCSSYL